MKKLITIIIAAALLLSMCACTKKDAGEGGEEGSSAAGGNSQADSGADMLPNPITEMTRKQLAEETGIDLSAPSGAKDTMWSVINLSDGNQIAQLTYTLDGVPVALRAIDAESGESDISGQYYDWVNSKSSSYGGVAAQLFWNDGEAGHIYWNEDGIRYCLSVSSDASEELLLSLSGINGEEDDPADGALRGILADIAENYHPGTAGSSLTGARIAAQLLDWQAEYRTDAETAFDTAEDYIMLECPVTESEFAERLGGIYSMAEEITGPNGKSLLDDSGYTSTAYPWSGQSIDDLFAPLFTASGGSLPLSMTVYYSQGSGFGTRVFHPDEITADAVADGLRAVDMLGEKVKVNSLKSSGGKLQLDLSSEFLTWLESVGADKEGGVIAAVAATFMDAFDAEGVMITVNSQPLETENGSYLGYMTMNSAGTGSQSGTSGSTETSGSSAASGGAEASGISETAAKLIETARGLIGAPFALGGTGPDTFDNSGFVYYCCAQVGIKIPRTKSTMFSTLDVSVAKEDLQPGDLVFFSLDAGGSKAALVGIYLGDGKFISEGSETSPVGERNFNSTYYSDRFVGARRVA